MTKYQLLIADAFKYAFRPDGTWFNTYANPIFYEVSNPYSSNRRCFTSILGENGWYQNKDGFTCYNVFKAIGSLTDEKCIEIMNNYGLYNDHHHTSIKFNYNDKTWWS